MLHMPSPMLLPPASGPMGQQLFTAAGDFSSSFVVPSGVTKICAVAIGRGADAAYYPANDVGASGGGGGLAYSNDITVTPGETLAVEGDASGYRLRRGGTVLVEAANASEANGGNGLTGQVTFKGGNGSVGGPEARTGGGAAGYTSNGGNGPRNASSNGGGGSSPLGGGAGASGGGSPALSGQQYGGGGGTTGTGSQGAGARGCVRILWGDGRAYPNTNPGDV